MLVVCHHEDDERRATTTTRMHFVYARNLSSSSAAASLRFSLLASRPAPSPAKLGSRMCDDDDDMCDGSDAYAHLACGGVRVLFFAIRSRRVWSAMFPLTGAWI